MLSILHCLCLQHQHSCSLRKLIICSYGLQTSALGTYIPRAIIHYIIWESLRAQSVSVCAQGCRNNVGLQLSPVCMSASSSWLELSPPGRAFCFSFPSSRDQCSVPQSALGWVSTLLSSNGCCAFHRTGRGMRFICTHTMPQH